MFRNGSRRVVPYYGEAVLSRSYKPATEADEGGIRARVWPSRLRHPGVGSRSTRRQVRNSQALAVQRGAVARALRDNEQMLSTTRAARWDCHHDVVSSGRAIQRSDRGVGRIVDVNPVPDSLSVAEIGTCC
jgi:hypothetical protein